jgi:hypothetical protein
LRGWVDVLAGGMFTIHGSFMLVLRFGRKFQVFEIRRCKQFEHSIAEQEFILTIIKPEPHPIEVKQPCRPIFGPVNQFLGNGYF